MTKLNLREYLNRPIDCECGKTHFAGIEVVEIEEGALSKVASLIKGGGYGRPFLIADLNTHQVAGQEVEKQLGESGLAYTSFVFQDENLVADERALGSLLLNFPRDSDLIVAIGSGTITDLARYFSFQLGLEFMAVATAPSMDGYASTVAPLLRNNLKTTFECHGPWAIVADLTILAAAPPTMITAGVGDVIGKSTCLADWQLATLITGDYYCEFVASLTRNSLARTIGLLDGIKRGEKQAIGGLMETLILSGIAMGYVGNSRPASGAEHHLSHFWELRAEKASFHGAQVGVATVLVLQLYHALSQSGLSPDGVVQSKAIPDPNWEQEIERVYLTAAPEVIALEAKVGKNDLGKRQVRIGAVAQNWDAISEVLKSVPSSMAVAEMLQVVQAPTTYQELGLSPQLVLDALMYAKELRPRYTILQLLWDLGLLRDFAKQSLVINQ